MKYVMVLGGSADAEGNLSIDTLVRMNVGIATARKIGDARIIYCVRREFQIEHRTAERSIEFFIENGWPAEKILWNPVGSNTLTEAIGALEVLRRERANEVTVVTHWYHIPRTWLYWKFLDWSGTIKFVPCWKTGNVIGSLVWEVLGFIRLIQRLADEQIAALQK